MAHDTATTQPPARLKVGRVEGWALAVAKTSGAIRRMEGKVHVTQQRLQIGRQWWPGATATAQLYS